VRCDDFTLGDATARQYVRRTTKVSYRTCIYTHVFRVAEDDKTNITSTYTWSTQHRLCILDAFDISLTTMKCGPQRLSIALDRSSGSRKRSRPLTCAFEHFANPARYPPPVVPAEVKRLRYRYLAAAAHQSLMFTAAVRPRLVSGLADRRLADQPALTVSDRWVPLDQRKDSQRARVLYGLSPEVEIPLRSRLGAQPA
jgi:hypothetical protein